VLFCNRGWKEEWGVAWIGVTSPPHPRMYAAAATHGPAAT
jgi:hypothetical protein